jgi:hypothetical protein
MFDDIPIEEYFRYHPPTTEERKAKHNEVNDICLKVARDLTQPFLSCAEVGAGMDKLIALTQLIKDETCLKWANWSIDSLWVVVKNRGGDTESVIMRIQQVRMFLNQGITIDELKAQL